MFRLNSRRRICVKCSCRCRKNFFVTPRKEVHEGVGENLLVAHSINAARFFASASFASKENVGLFVQEATS